MRSLTIGAVFVAVVLTSLTAVDRAAADTFGSGANMFDIELVTIGNPGNDADTTGRPNPAGSVSYVYRIGKFEISEDMINKANALGSLGITHDNRGANKPATSITWFEAVKFVNWLNTSTGHSPAYSFDGSGDFQLWIPSDAGYNPSNLYRNSLARYFLPSVHEWYKAAFYDPIAEAYYEYPTGSDNIPDGIDFAGDTTFEAVFNDGYIQGGPNDISNVGVLSPYGTAGQGGNVFEWEETEYDFVNDLSSSARGFRGGGWSSHSGELHALSRGSFNAAGEINFGFRVASTPEPSSLSLAFLVAAVISSARMRRTCDSRLSATYAARSDPAYSWPKAMWKTLKIVGAVAGTVALMVACGLAAGFAAFDFLVRSGLRLHDGNAEYYFYAVGGGWPALAFVFGCAAFCFLVPGVIAWYLRKHA